jgi:hypothetical protein
VTLGYPLSLLPPLQLKAAPRAGLAHQRKPVPLSAEKLAEIRLASGTPALRTASVRISPRKFTQKTCPRSCRFILAEAVLLPRAEFPTVNLIAGAGSAWDATPQDCGGG